jgi:hypothetical protein
VAVAVTKRVEVAGRRFVGGGSWFGIECIRDEEIWWWRLGVWLRGCQGGDLEGASSGRGSRGGIEEEILRGLAARSNLANDGG